jgi:hypothetical protein
MIYKAAPERSWKKSSPTACLTSIRKKVSTLTARATGDAQPGDHEKPFFSSQDPPGETAGDGWDGDGGETATRRGHGREGATTSATGRAAIVGVRQICR